MLRKLITAAGLAGTLGAAAPALADDCDHDRGETRYEYQNQYQNPNPYQNANQYQYQGGGYGNPYYVDNRWRGDHDDWRRDEWRRREEWERARRWRRWQWHHSHGYWPGW